MKFPFFVGWHNRKFFLVPLEEKRRLHVAAPPLWRGHKPCRALAVPSSPVFSYKSNAMVDADGTGTTGKDRDLFMQVAMANHVIMMFMQFLERAWL